MSLHPQPHCATATGFHDNMSIVPERYDHEVFKKMSFENSNSKFVTAMNMNMNIELSHVVNANAKGAPHPRYL